MKQPAGIVTLTDVLDTKEQRAAYQQELRERHRSPVISLTVNMPGPVKYTAEIMDMLYGVTAKLRSLLAANGLAMKEERICHLPAGPAVLLAVDGDAAGLKRYAVQLESGLPYGRLLDIDVFTAEGRQISRSDIGLASRTCFACQCPAIECMRSSTHSRQEIQAAVDRLLTAYQVDSTAVWPEPVAVIGRTALTAMLLEVACTPAPGLVDRHNSGAHQDMDFFSFVLSSSVVQQAMYRCALAGWLHTGPRPALLPVLRGIGQAAEREMFAATGGVNTQKGLLFLLGVLAAAAAMLWRRQAEGKPEPLLLTAADICAGIVGRELEALRQTDQPRKLTAGERLYLDYGITGVRGEIEAGFPAVRRQGLPQLEQALAAGLSLNDALVHALVALMCEVPDTTIVNRHDLAALRFVQQEAHAAMLAGGMLTAEGKNRIADMDTCFIERNISPGGSADLLAATYFVHALAQQG